MLVWAFVDELDLTMCHARNTVGDFNGKNIYFKFINVCAAMDTSLFTLLQLQNTSEKHKVETKTRAAQVCVCPVT